MLAAALIAALAVPVLAQDHAPWLLATQVELDGNTTFSTAAIRRAFARNAHVIDEVFHAADDAARRDLIAEHVADGYRAAGFVAATVRAEAKGTGPLLLHVDEGPRCRYGSIRTTGNDRLATADLITRLQEPAGSWNGWTGDAYAACNRGMLDQARRRVISAYASVARYGIAADVDFVRADDRVDLVITVRDEGRVARVGKLRLDGELAADTAAVLARIQPAEDTLLTEAFTRSLRTQLEDLGRYTSIRFVSDPADAATTAMNVQVAVASFAPRIDAMPWDDLAQLRAGIGTLRSHIEAGRFVQLPILIDKEQTFAGFTLPAGHLLVQFTKNAVALHCEALRHPDGTVAPADVMLGAGRAFVQFGDGACGHVEYDDLAFHLQITTAPASDGQFELRWGFGWSTGKASSLSLSIHPATALNLLQRSLVRRDGDDLVFDVFATQVRCDRTGTVRSVEKDGRVAASLLQTTFAEATATALGRFDAGHTQPLAAYLLQFVSRRAPAMLEAITPVQRDAFALLRSTSGWLRVRRREPAAPPGEDFAVSPGRASAGMPNWLELLGEIVVAQTPRASWASLLMCSQRGVLRHDDAALRAVDDVAASKTAGPIALAASATLLDSAGHRELADRHLELAIERCTAAATFADLQALVSSDAPPPWLVALAIHLRTDPALAAVFAGVPAEAGALQVLERAFARCWDAGLGMWLREQLAERD